MWACVSSVHRSREDAVALGFQFCTKGLKFTLAREVLPRLSKTGSFKFHHLDSSQAKTSSATKTILAKRLRRRRQLHRLAHQTGNSSQLLPHPIRRRRTVQVHNRYMLLSQEIQRQVMISVIRSDTLNGCFEVVISAFPGLTSLHDSF